jgi:hypothetical protein
MHLAFVRLPLCLWVRWVVDLKSKNIFVSEDYTSLLADFGNRYAPPFTEEKKKRTSIEQILFLDPFHPVVLNSSATLSLVYTRSYRHVQPYG